MEEQHGIDMSGWRDFKGNPVDVQLPSEEEWQKFMQGIQEWRESPEYKAMIAEIHKAMDDAGMSGA